MWGQASLRSKQETLLIDTDPKLRVEASDRAASFIKIPESAGAYIG
jgi:hypothetical protein